MSKTKILTYLVVALLILNIGTITVLIFGKPPHSSKGRGGPKQIVIERLQFDKVQINQYQKLIDIHKNQARQKNDELRATKDVLFQLLRQQDQSQKDSLITAIGKIQMELELLNFKHFKDIKNICKPEQLDRYNKLSRDIGKLFTSHKRKKK